MEERIKEILPYLNEKQRRLFLGNEAKHYGYGGVQKVHEITKVSKTTIMQGKKEIEISDPKESRIRKEGGGRREKKSKRKKPKISGRNREYHCGFNIWKSRKSVEIYDKKHD